MFTRVFFVFVVVNGVLSKDLRINLNGLEERSVGVPSVKTGELLSNWNPDGEVNAEELGEYAEGDILFVGQGRNGLAASSTRWPRGVIPFKIEGDFDAFEMQMIEDAIDEYHTHTCIKFVPRSKEKDYIVIRSDQTGCWSSVGRVGGEQVVNLQNPACLKRKGTVIHELMHAAGFLHEQNREDRDDFVSVMWQNIQSNHEHNFKKAPRSSTNDFGVKYDFGSVMHYSPKAFSMNGKRTIEPKRSIDTEIGQRIGFSQGDIEKINYMYKCR